MLSNADYLIPSESISFSMSCIISTYGCVSMRSAALIASTAVLSIAIT